MSTSRKNTIHLCFFASSLLLVVSVTYSKISPHLKKPNMTPSPRLQQVFQRTKTVCFGRFQIDVPVSTAVAFGATDIDLEIDFLPNEGQYVSAYVEERLKKIKDETYVVAHSFLKAAPKFGKVLEGSETGQKLVFGSDASAFYDIHAYTPVGKDLFILHTNAALENDNDELALSEGVTLPQKLSKIARISKNLRALKPGEVPTQEGACIDGAIVTIPAGRYENIEVGFRLAEFPDVHLSISSRKMGDHVNEEDRLDARLERARQDGDRMGHRAWFDRIQYFRKGERRINLSDGYEALARLPAQPNQGESHRFKFYSVGAPNDPLRTMFDVELVTGVHDNTKGARPPSLTDDEVIALWDKLTGSIRTRAVTKPKAAPPSIPPLGAKVAAGALCPQDGWWECADEGAQVDGGRRRYFRQRERMPQAALLGTQSFSQWLGGHRPVHQTGTPTVWTLVDYRKHERRMQAVPFIAGFDESASSDTPASIAEVERGALYPSDAPCPATGWWECGQAGALDGPRWFRAGTPLPRATFPATRTWIESIAGSPDTESRHSTWRFIRYDETPPAAVATPRSTKQSDA